MWRGFFYSSIGSIGTIGTNGMSGQPLVFNWFSISHYWDLENIQNYLVMWRGFFYSSIGSIGTIGTNGMNGQSIVILLVKYISLLGLR